MFEFLFGKPKPEKSREERNAQLNSDIQDITSNLLIHFQKEIDETFYRHIDTLRRKENQLVYRDEYGDIISEDFWKEYEYFYQNKIPAQLRSDISAFIINRWKSYESSTYEYVFTPFLEIQQKLYILLRDRRKKEITANDDTLLVETDYDKLTPEEYEKLVSDCFSSCGWQSRTTAGSGDQGADVIAEKYGMRLVVQCKLYSNPVGNKAVQEVVSALKYYEGHLGLVVTNSTFTKSARQLADSCNVKLMNDDMIIPMLENFEKIREEDD